MLNRAGLRLKQSLTFHGKRVKARRSIPNGPHFGKGCIGILMTKEAYAFLEKLKKFKVKVPGPTVTVAAGMYFVTGNLLVDW